MHTQEDSNTSELIKAADASHCRVSLAQRQFLGFIAEVDRQEAWQDSGARDMAHWVCMRHGVRTGRLCGGSRLPTLWKGFP